MQNETATPQTGTQTVTAAAASPKHSIEVDVHDMIRLMHDFSLVLEKENEFLRAAKFEQIESLQEDKRTYVTRYKEKLSSLFERKDEFAAMDHALAEKLVRTRTDFVKLLNANLKTLALAKESSRRLVQRILDSARDTIEDKTNYNGTGAMQRSNPQTATSVQFNQEL